MNVIVGSGHIKFWKMSQTFTGLKLQGELGRFGKTEISDIVGIYPMPDEKVGIYCISTKKNYATLKYITILGNIRF